MRNSFTSFDFWNGLVSGVSICSVVSLALAGLFGGSFDAGAIATLATIPAVLFAATVAVIATRHQMTEARRQDLASAKAVLPLALSSFSEACEEAIQIATCQQSNPPSGRSEIRKSLTVPESVIAVLRDNIKSSDKEAREWLTVLVAHYQLCLARIDSWWDALEPIEDCNGVIHLEASRQNAVLDWATLHSISGNLFEYSRNRSAKVPDKLDPSHIKSSLFISISNVDFDEIFLSMLDLHLASLQDGSVGRFGIKR